MRREPRSYRIFDEDGDPIMRRHRVWAAPRRGLSHGAIEAIMRQVEPHDLGSLNQPAPVEHLADEAEWAA